MEQQASFRKTVGWLTVISVPFALINFILISIVSMAGNPDTMDFTDMSIFISAGVDGGSLMKWAWLADLFGYYLLLIPAAFFIHLWLKNRNPYWMGILTFSGLAYLFTGCLGAAIFAKTWPTLISGFANSSGTVQEIYRLLFNNTAEIVNGGIWGNLEFLLAGIWWIGVGFVMKEERKVLGILSVILGFFSLLTVFGHMFDMKVIANIGLPAYLLLSPLWATWLGITIIRGKDLQLAKP